MQQLTTTTIPTSPRLADNWTSTLVEQLARLERERYARLRSLWQMTVAERVAAMRRGDLTYEQLAAWSGRYPGQIPIVNDEFEWLAARTPEASE